MHDHAVYTAHICGAQPGQERDHLCVAARTVKTLCAALQRCHAALGHVPIVTMI